MDTYKFTFTIPAQKFFNDETERFVTVKETTVTICHSLRSIHQWESKWEQSFFTTDNKISFLDDKHPDPKANIKMTDYIRCMTLTQNVPDEAFTVIPMSTVEQIVGYMAAKMTATTFGKSSAKKPSRKKKRLTSEEIYASMFSNGVPLELENWHFNQLITLLQVIGEKSSPSGKLSPKDRASINAARRARHHSKG